MVYAAWWNPMSWNLVERIFNRGSREKQEQTIETTTPTEEDKFEELNRKIEELEKKLSGEKSQSETTKSPSITKIATPTQTVTTPLISTKTNSSGLSNQEVISLVKPAVVYISTEDGSGSGFIFDSSGYILTNAHVVEGFSSVEVVLNNKRRLTANVIGINNLSSDVAVLKLDSGGIFPSAKLGDSGLLSQGDEVFLFGFPLGVEGDVSFKEGTVSRKFTEDNIEFIEMSAEAHPGNSGGPLVNRKGEVVGVHSFSYGRVGEKIKFSIAINHVKQQLTDLKDGMQLLTSKTRSETESVVRSRLTGLDTKISDSPEISKAISSAYNESSFAYYEKQVLAGVDNTNESQENLRKSYLNSISSGYRIIVAGMEVLKNITQSFNEFYSSNQANLGSISNTFARNKFTEFGTYTTSKANEYDKRIANIYSKISDIDGVLKKGKLKELPTSYFTQQRDTFKAEINYISAQKDDIINRSWIKSLF